jgi:hypothetical protein
LLWDVGYISRILDLDIGGAADVAKHAFIGFGGVRGGGLGVEKGYRISLIWRAEDEESGCIRSFLVAGA